MSTRLMTLVGTRIVLVGALLIAGYALIRSFSNNSQAQQGSSRTNQTPGQPIRVNVGHPAPGGYEALTEQPGIVMAFEKADLYGQVSGILKSQAVDIGDEVKQGQVLAEIDAPDRVREMEHAAALLKQAHAQVELMTARVAKAEATVEAVKIDVGTAKANRERADSVLSLRGKEYDRLKSLLAMKSIDERVVDEKLEEREAAAADLHAAKVAIETALAKVTSAVAGVGEAKANLEEAHSEVGVAQAELAKAKVYVDYTRIVCPYDGIITLRNFNRGDFIRDASSGGQTPMLSVARSDLMRVVVQIPNSDVPRIHVGNRAEVKIQTLRGRSFPGKVSRIARSEDRRNLTMRAEIDLKNDDGLLFDGMYGSVVIHFDSEQESLAIPTSSLVATSDDQQGVYLVRDGKARLTPLEVGGNDGVQAEILSGLNADDLFVLNPGSGLADGTAVTAIEQKVQHKAEQSHRESATD